MLSEQTQNDIEVILNCFSSAVEYGKFLDYLKIEESEIVNQFAKLIIASRELT